VVPDHKEVAKGTLRASIGIVAGMMTIDFGNIVLLPRVGHAAERQWLGRISLAMTLRRFVRLFVPLFAGCAPASQPVAGHTTVGELHHVFSEFVKSDHATVVFTAAGTSKFVQFSGGRGGVEMDFPLVEADQLAREQAIREFSKKRGLNVVENRGSDGSRFLDILLPPDPTKLAEYTKSAFAEVLEISSEATVEVMGEGFSWSASNAR